MSTQHISASNSGSTYTSGLGGPNPFRQAPRRGVPRQLALVWLEREDELIPAPWADFVMRRFFHHATASYGVIIESPDIPWETHPGEHLREFVSWEALDIEVRRVTLQQAADVLPNPKWSEEADKFGRGSAAGSIRQYQDLPTWGYGSSPLPTNVPNIIFPQ